MNKKQALIIPARFNSTRFPGKPLAHLRGQEQTRTLIGWVYARACEIMPPAHIFIATDDVRIQEHAQDFGAQVLMTPDCQNGTERVAHAARLLPDYEIFLNLQGDAPLMPADFLTALIAPLEQDPTLAMTTPALRMDATTLAHFRTDQAAGRVGGTCVVFDKDHRALYFSKAIIPYAPKETAHDAAFFHHVGAYAYRRDALERYLAWGPAPLETLEGLEQLRFLENGASIQCIEVNGQGRVFWEINNPIDIERVEPHL